MSTDSNVFVRSCIELGVVVIIVIVVDVVGFEGVVGVVPLITRSSDEVVFPPVAVDELPFVVEPLLQDFFLPIMLFELC